MRPPPAGTSPPADEPLSGRSSYAAGVGAAASSGGGSDGGLGWKVALAVVLPVLALALLGLHVRCQLAHAC